MTVKMTSAKSRCVVFLMTFVMVQSGPLDFTTSRYSEETIELHDNSSSPFPVPSSSRKAPRIFDIALYESNFVLPEGNRNSRRSKSPRNQEFHSEELMRNLRTVNFKNNDSFFGNSTVSVMKPEDNESRKFSNKKTILYSNSSKVTNGNKIKTKSSYLFPTQNSPKLSEESKNKSRKTNSSRYENFVTNPIKHIQTLESLPNRPKVSPVKKNIKNEPQKPSIFEIRVPKPTITPKPAKFSTITHTPIIIKLTKVPSNFSSSYIATRPTIKTTRTPGWISKIKSSTPIPTSSTKSNNFGWPNTKVKNKNDWNRYKNYTELNISNKVTTKRPSPTRRKTPATPPSKRRKPTKPTRIKYTSKPGHKPTIEEIKQNWYENGVPYPNPMPEISSNSPTFVPNPLEEPPTAGDTDSVLVDTAEENNPLTNAISTFNLDMRPATTNLKDTAGSGCPTVHISSSVLSAQQRQECSDLNLVINSHFHQNTASDRIPSIDTYQAENPEEDVPIEAVEEPVEDVGQAETGVAEADPGAAQQDPAQAVQADSAGGSSPGSGGTGGSGANGGNGGNGGDGNSGMGWPDIKGMLDAIDWLGNKFGHLFSFLRNPYLYLIPAALFFLLGFFLIIALFPWWVPLLFLLVGIKAKHKPNVVHHKHIHKPIHHPDGWFWNQHTKTWENVQDYLHRRRIDNVNLNHIPQAIDSFGKKYGLDNIQLKTIKKIR